MPTPITRYAACHVPVMISLVLALSSTAMGAQTQVAWERGFQDAANVVNAPVDLVALPGDGVALLFGAKSSSAATEEATLVRMSENGDVLWTWVAAGPPIALGADSSGGLYALTADVARSTVTCLNSDGTERWSLDLEGPVTGVNYTARCMDVAPSGEIRVAGNAFSTSLFPRAIVHAVDPNGQELWRFDPSGGTNGSTAYGFPSRVVLDSAGSCYVMGLKDFCCGEDTWDLHVVSPTGTLERRETGPGSGESSFVLRFGAEGSTGVVAVAYDGITVPAFNPVIPSMEMRVYDGAAPLVVDLLNYVSDPLAANRIMDLESDGTANFLVGIEGPDQVLRFSAGGDLLMGSTVPGSIASLTPTADGGVFVLCGTASAGELQLVRLDASGSILWTRTHQGIAPEGSNAGPPDLVLDSRGNAFAATELPLATNPSGSRAAVSKWIDGSSVGAPYCGPAPLNSTGASATIRALGSSGAQQNNVTLISGSMPPSTTVLLLASTDPGFISGPGGSAGNLCLGGAIGRYLLPGQIRTATPDGSASLQIDLTAIPQPSSFLVAAAGQTWRFQSWFRDVIGGAQSSNFTDAVAVTLQ